MNQKRQIHYQNPPSSCDLCQKAITVVFYDCVVTTYRTGWANVCPECFEIYGRGLGVGLGQKWQRIQGKYYKTQG